MNTLPPIRTRGFSPHIDPVVVIDTREQDPLPIAGLRSIRGTLQSGDYSFIGGEANFAVERKSIDDLVSCCAGDNRERFERELHRLRGFAFARFLIIGSREDLAAGRYRSRMDPRSVLGSLDAWEARYRTPIAYADNPATAAQMVERWVWWFAREYVLDINRLLASPKPDTKPEPENY